MNRNFVRFVFTVGALCLGFLSDAVAAPSVKRLGGTNAYLGVNNAVSAKSGVSASKATDAVARTSSNRSNRLTSVKTVPVVKTISSSGVSDTSRLSVGKYLHNAGQNAGIIKPVSGSTVNPAAAETVEELTGRVEVLEGKIETKAESGDYYTKQEIDDKNYVTKSELEEADYVNATDLNTVSNAASALSTSLSTLWGRVSRVEDALGAGEHLAKDWETQGLVFE